MIKFSLRCDQGHAFDSWFKAGKAFDDLVARDMVQCPVCGSNAVTKALMAPAVALGQQQKQPPPPPTNPTPTLQKSRDAEQKLKALRKQIETNSEYVGDSFAAEARAMYLGDIPDRPIYGEAQPQEAKALIEEGVPVMPLPFIPSRKSN